MDSKQHKEMMKKLDSIENLMKRLLQISVADAEANAKMVDAILNTGPETERTLSAYEEQVMRMAGGR